MANNQSNGVLGILAASQKGSYTTIDAANFLTPDMGDSLKEIDPLGYFKNIEKALHPSVNAEGSGALFFVEKPYSESLGYHEDGGVFIIKAKPIVGDKDEDGKKYTELNRYDGDTIYCDTDTIEDGGKPFTINGLSFKNFRQYVGLANPNAVFEGVFGMRTIGINAPEIPHYEYIPSSGISGRIQTFSIEEITGDPSYSYDKTQKRIAGKKYPFVQLADRLTDPWHEIVKGREDAILGEPNYDPPMTADERKEAATVALRLYNAGEEPFKYYLIVTKDDSKMDPAYHTAGINAKNEVRKMILEADDMLLMIDAKTISRLSGSMPKPYDDDYFTPGNALAHPLKAIENLWAMLFGPTQKYRYLGYSLYGQDNYRRFLGTIYIKTKGVWINLSKYLMVKIGEHIEPLPDYTSDPLQESHYGFASDAFKLWTYAANDSQVVDSLFNLSTKDFDDRREIQKKIMNGVDFDSLRDYTMMIGDCLLMVPPTSVRIVSQTDTERIPLIRAKGSMVKSIPKSERLIELTLYFNDGGGINGVPYNVDLPGKDENGNQRKATYYMNGLRSLIAMFKLTPFLPIENHLINDILNIEAVSLANIKISTLPSYPRCLVATLTLQEFNYLVYMPELPKPDVDKGENINKNIFASAINYELMRYYYQRPLQTGERIKALPFESKEYLSETFGGKTALLPMTFQSPEVDFYVVDKDYLEQQLQLKLSAMDRPLTSTAPLSEAAKEWRTQLAQLYFSVAGMSKNESLESILKRLQEKSDGRELLYKRDASYVTNASRTVSNFRLDKTQLIRASKTVRVDENGQSFNDIANVITGGELAASFGDGIYDVVAGLLVGTAPLVEAIDMHEDVEVGENAVKVQWKILLKLSYGNMTSKQEIEDFYALVSQENTKLDKNTFLEDGMVALSFTGTFKNEAYGSMTSGEFEFDTYAPGYKFLEHCAAVSGFSAADGLEGADSEEWDMADSADYSEVLSAQKQSIDQETLESLRFVKYELGAPGVIRIQSLSAGFGNTLTKLNLQALDGYASQYVGGQDTVIEITMETMDENVVLLMTHLPRLAAQYARDYKLVLPCWPVRINSEITKLLGVNEVLIESVDVKTVPGQPGLFSLALRLVSVDRTMRNREALSKLDVDSNAGFNGANAQAQNVTKTYFDVKDTLAQAEIYPDLELPTLAQMERDGYKFMRYASSPRKFPDPDFYFTYGHILGHEIFRDSLIHSLNGELLEMDADNNPGQPSSGNAIPEFEITDRYGAKLTLTPRAGSGYAIKPGSENNTAMSMIDGKTAVKASYDEVAAQALDAIEEPMEDSEIVAALAATEAYRGWNVADSIRCMFREKRYEKAIKEDPEQNKLVASIDEVKNKIIAIIDEELFSPIVRKVHLNGFWGLQEFSSGEFDEFLKSTKLHNEITSGEGQAFFIRTNIDAFVDDYFKDGRGKRLFDAFGFQDSVDMVKNMKKMLHAAASAATGEREYNPGQLVGNSWKSQAFRSINPTWIAGDAKQLWKDDAGNAIPIAKIDKVKGQSDSSIDVWANSLKDAMEYGVTFGTFQIPFMTKEQVQEITGKKADTTEAMMFLDPYYGRYVKSEGSYYGSEAVAENYKKAILVSPYTGAHAFFRNMLVYMKKMLQDNLLYSLYDMVQDEALDVLHERITIEEAKSRAGTTTPAMEEWDPMEKPDASQIGPTLTAQEYLRRLNIYNARTTAVAAENIQAQTQQPATEAEIAEEKAAVEKAEAENALLEEQAQAEARAMLEALKKVLEGSRMPLAIGKMFAPALLAVTGGSPMLYSLMKERNYDVLDDITKSALLPTANPLQDTAATANMRKFLLALSGHDLIKSVGYIGQKGEYLSQTMDTLIHEKIFIKAAENPIAYVQHSFYDMVVNDKRGRMLRAFPTYYMMFIDEGREIGQWKLHDNFYNMSAIAEIQVVKSRKIAADTASITMSNMFKSYTTDDEDQREGYSYDWKDVFTSIFTPRIAYMEEEARRQRAEKVDKVRLQPGARIHLRMGYGSDASTLPILFNGCIAEVGAGEVVNIIAQGDGVELTNPLMTTSDAEDVQHQDKIVINKQFNEWITTGATPRTILASLLTTRGGWLKKNIRNFSNGRFFNDNPYGIVHFGDPDCKDIFPNGEGVQNLYEALARPSWGDDPTVLNDITKDYAMASAPKLSTHVFGKSFWDIMHICASVEPDFITSIVPFGMRSSIFYGAPRYYYAYDYEKGEQGQLLEKRKPFQQYHIYTSYSDIMANTIKASDFNVKTCAVGLYSSKGWFNRETAGKVGPMWADFDIYPEKQKTMTVDTQFIAKGTIAGSVIPFLNQLQNDFADDKGAIQGGYQIAWRMTASALKDSIKDMYQGEMIVIGDPTVKPYDKVFTHDIFERMEGSFGVEAVVHNLTADSGYTTSVFADCITAVDDRQERIAQHVAAKAVGNSLAAYAGVWAMTAGYTQRARPLLTAAMRWGTLGAGGAQTLYNGLVETLGKKTWELSDEKFLKGATAIGNSVNVSPVHQAYQAFFNNANKWASTLGKLPKDGLKEPAHIAAYMKNIADTAKNADSRELVASLQQAIKSGKMSPAEIKAADEMINTATKYTSNVLSEINTHLQVFDSKDAQAFMDILTEDWANLLLDPTATRAMIDEAEKAVDIARRMGTSSLLNSADDADGLAKAFMTVSKSTDEDLLVGLAGKVKTIFNGVDDVAGGGLAVGLKSLDDVFETSGVLSKIWITGFGAAPSLAVKLIGMGIWAAVTTAVTSYALEYAERWMRNLQVVQVFPLRKDGRVMTAGLDGSKGIVVGSPTADTPGDLQEWIGSIFDKKAGFWGGVYNVVRDYLITTQDMQNIAAGFRKSHSLPDPDSVIGRETLVQDMYAAISADQMASFNSYRGALLKPRIKRFNSPEGDHALLTYNNQGTDLAQMETLLTTDMIYLPNSKVIQDLREKKFFYLAHQDIPEGEELPQSYQIMQKSIGEGANATQIPVIINQEVTEDGTRTITDMPFLRPDALYLLTKIIEDTRKELGKEGRDYGDKDPLEVHPFVLRSALRVNDPKGWPSTGFQFRLQVVDFNEFGALIDHIATEQAAVLKSALIEDGTEESFIAGKFFSYRKVEDDTYDFMVSPPKSV